MKLSKFSGFSSDCFAVLVTGMAIVVGLRPAMAQRTLGVDVSGYQGGSINWMNVKDAGIAFAWTKAAEATPSDGYIDPSEDFDVNEKNGKAAGIYMGAYYFAHPDLDSPVTAANYFWGVAGSYILADGKTIMPMLDMEDFKGLVGATSYSDWANQWCNYVMADAAAVGVAIKPVLYVSACNAGNFDSSVSRWISSIANYNGENAQGGTPWNVCSGDDIWGQGVWSVWQYSTNGSVFGISGNVDEDIFNGTLDAMISSLVAGSPSPSVPSMVLIPAGPFSMGDSLNDGYSDELPVHTVYVSAFYMDQNLVTEASWDDIYQWAATNGYSFDNPGSGRGTNHPVQTINWWDAVKWCNARSEQEGLTPCYYTDSTQATIYRSGQIVMTNACVNWSANGYRLPTEAEWEKAARGGLNGQRFPWGDTIDETRANYYSCTNCIAQGCSNCYLYDVNPISESNPTWDTGPYPWTNPGGAFAPNAYGLYDMAGNVWEWCWDWYDSSWYGSPAATQNDTKGPATSLCYRVFRGGAWDYLAFGARSAHRGVNAGDPCGLPVSAANQLGFRCVSEVYNLASAPIAPLITTQPTSQSTPAEADITFSVTVTGPSPLNYQWQFNGASLFGATSSTLAFNSVTAANSGGYSVVVSNPYGSATSDTASLAVLTDGANGNKPVQIIAQSIPSKPIGAHNLLFVTHGWEPGLTEPDSPQWVSDICNDIQTKVSADWQIVPYFWVDQAWTLTPMQALSNAKNIGTQIGKELANASFQQVHLIAHSAGSGLIQAIADQLSSLPNPPEIQLTFLDPYLGFFLEEQDTYGHNADWSDCYFVEDGTGGFTSGNLTRAFNVDVSWVDPAHTTAPYVGLTGGEVALSSHGYPSDFYIQSITDTDSNWCAAGYGFPLSIEKAGVFWINNQANDPVGSDPFLPCSLPDAVKNPNPGITGTEAGIAGIPADISDAAHAVSDFGSSLVGDSGFILNSIFSVPQANGIHPSGGPVPQDGGGPASINTPAWLAVDMTVTNAVNFIQFDGDFTDTNAAQGLLTVYWNTNQVGMVDERVAETNLRTYRFALPGTVTGGLYTLSFRLDSFDNSSSIVVTNVATGFVGVTQPVTLAISLTNNAPLLQLTAATNFAYLVQSSTNLVDWTPAALLLNTNGTVQFMDSAVNNSSPRFYRAVTP